MPDDGALRGQVIVSSSYVSYVSIRMTVAEAIAVIEAAQTELATADENGSITKSELWRAEKGIDAMAKAVRRATG